MDNHARFGLFYLLVLLCAQMGFSLSELVALVSPTRASAYAIQGLVSTLFSLFSGFLIAKSNMPIGWQWAYYISYVSLALCVACHFALWLHELIFFCVLLLSFCPLLLCFTSVRIVTRSLRPYRMK